MDRASWQKLKEPFYTALGLSPEARSAYLEKHFADDPQSRAELEALLQAHEKAGEFIELPVFEKLLPRSTPKPEPLTEASTLGPYRLLRELGRGGMGVVYLAVRDDEVVKKQVALKVIQGGMAKESIARRFRTERQALATLEHPNIARFLDGGFTDDGRPYYVMEYVAGEPIHRFCDCHRLTLRQRLELFRQVCAAVHYAHQNLIVHRDLKPDNILVTPAGIPKLLDFGIAKILKPELFPQTLMVTKERWQLMTPAYASPEQVRGDAITTASDVYSLGVLLYELLSGHRPYRFKSRTPREIERVICEHEPEKPSTAVARGEKTRPDDTRATVTPETGHKTRQEPPEKLRRRLTGDLDNIVMMAMRKEPERRYASVEQFSEDVRRHLAGLPVMARRSTLTYQSFKFISRHRRGVFAAALIFLILVAGVASTAWQAKVAKAQRQKAEQRFNDVRKLANALIFEIHDAITDLPGSTSARRLLVSRALHYLDVLANESKDDPSLQLELAWTYKKIADVQGNPNNANLGDLSGALESYHKGVALAEEQTAVDPHSLEALRAQAVIYEKLSDVQSWSGDLPNAIASSQKSLETFNELAAIDPKNRKSKQSLAISHLKLGDILGNPNFPNLGKVDGALQHYQQALSILNVLTVSDSSDVSTRRHLGLIHERIGTIFEVKSQPAQAAESYQKSMLIRSALAKEWPNHYDIRRDWAIGYEKIANMHKAFKQPAEALENYRKSLAIFEELYNADPENTNAQRSVSFSYEHIGDVLETQGQLVDAQNFYRRSLVLRERLTQNDPKNRKDKSDLGRTLFRLANLSTKNGKPGVARTYTLRLLKLQNKQANSPEATAYDLNDYAWFLLACEPESLRNPAAALPYARKAVEMSEGRDANILDTLARAYFLTGDHKLAVETTQKALALLPANSPLHRELEANVERFRTAADTVKN